MNVEAITHPPCIQAPLVRTLQGLQALNTKLLRLEAIRHGVSLCTRKSIDGRQLPGVEVVWQHYLLFHLEHFLPPGSTSILTDEESFEEESSSSCQHLSFPGAASPGGGTKEVLEKSMEQQEIPPISVEGIISSQDFLALCDGEVEQPNPLSSSILNEKGSQRSRKIHTMKKKDLEEMVRAEVFKATKNLRYEMSQCSRMNISEVADAKTQGSTKLPPVVQDLPSPGTLAVAQGSSGLGRMGIESRSARGKKTDWKAPWRETTSVKRKEKTIVFWIKPVNIEHCDNLHSLFMVGSRLLVSSVRHLIALKLRVLTSSLELWLREELLEEGRQVGEVGLENSTLTVRMNAML